MDTTNNIHWHALKPEDAAERLNSSFEGLPADEAKERLKNFGPNRIEKRSEEGPLIILWRQINNPLIWVLIGSGILAVLLGKVTDGLVVLGVVVINTIIGFIQEYRAGKAIEALSEMIPENARVLRDGMQVLLPVAELVPGDVVFLEAGDRVPADMRLIQQKNLAVQEAALTGESVPAQKSIDPVEEDAVIGDRHSMLYSGTLIVSGTAKALVATTGMATELGKISDMLVSTPDLQTPLTQKLATIGKYLTIGIGLLTLVILVVGVLRATGNGMEFIQALKESLIFAIALAVGAIPEGLPAIVTIALAIGVQRMARRNAIIRKLPAVETLGSTTVICSDKTGTLTRNEMTVNVIHTPHHQIEVTGVGYNLSGAFVKNNDPVNDLPEEIMVLLRSAVLCSDAGLKAEDGEMRVSGDPTEIALLIAAGKAGMKAGELEKKYPRLDVIPFDSDNQFMATLNEGDPPAIIMKGAPEMVVRRCSQVEDGKPIRADEVLQNVDVLAGRGLRVLAVAGKPAAKGQDKILPEDTLEGFTFMGLIAMIDPPRPEAIEAIHKCHQAGIVVKMITGDHQTTALAIGKKLGLTVNDDAINGTELSGMSDEALKSAATQTNIFARVAPEHKLRLVRALQQENHIVAMTGDGVNDAPSLKQSNIGVAMGITGTSVSKESADIVLADDNFASIGAAVEEGRRVYDNLLKSLAFVLPTNLGLAFILIYGIMFFPFVPDTGDLLLPILPVQLLWINLVAAVALALPLAFEAKEHDVMRRPPRKPDAPLFNRFVTYRVVLVSLLMT
ncbi:MAG: cation-translocating P-type ATPase, partial [Bacteroidales bacterium]